MYDVLFSGCIILWAVMTCGTFYHVILQHLGHFSLGRIIKLFFEPRCFFYKGLHNVTCSFVFQRISKAFFFCRVQISDIQYLITRKNITESSTYKLERKVSGNNYDNYCHCYIFLKFSTIFSRVLLCVQKLISCTTVQCTYFTLYLVPCSLYRA